MLLWLASKCTRLTILDVFLSIGLIASNSSLNSIQVSGIDLEAPTGLLSQAHGYVKLGVQERKHPTSKRTTRQRRLFIAETSATFFANNSLTRVAVKGRFTGNTASSGACLLKPGDNPASSGTLARHRTPHISGLSSIVVTIVDTSNYRSKITEGQRVITP